MPKQINRVALDLPQSTSMVGSQLSLIRFNHSAFLYNSYAMEFMLAFMGDKMANLG